MMIVRPLSWFESSRANGRAVDLPAPGGACSTTGTSAARWLSRAGSSASTGKCSSWGPAETEDGDTHTQCAEAANSNGASVNTHYPASYYLGNIGSAVKSEGNKRNIERICSHWAHDSEVSKQKLNNDRRSAEERNIGSCRDIRPLCT